MRKLAVVSLSLMLGSSISFAKVNIEEIAQRCQKPTAEFIYNEDFKWNYSIEEMMQKFSEMYLSPKRLAKHAYWDNQKKKIMLPYDDYRGGHIEVSPRFLEVVARHISVAFENKYVDALFFPDMGHSHLLIPTDSMKEKYHKYPVTQMARMYEAFFEDPAIKILYHTAEQLQTLDENGEVLRNPHIQWRFKTRNIVGENQPMTELTIHQNPESRANTVHEVPGYHWWGAGFNISANKDGCFSVEVGGRKMFFDLSMYDLEPQNSSPFSF